MLTGALWEHSSAPRPSPAGIQSFVQDALPRFSAITTTVRPRASCSLSPTRHQD